VAVDGQGNVYISDSGHNAVKQFSPVYLFLVVPSMNEAASAGTDSIPVQVLPASTPLTAASSQSWLTITGTGGGAVGYAFQANTSANSRSAHISVLGQAVRVTQNGDTPATITKTAGYSQSALPGLPFPIALQVHVKDAAGNGVELAKVTFTVTPGSTGASGTFSAVPPMPILTGASGYATAPSLFANGIAGKFTVTASVGGLTTVFSLTITTP